MKKNLFMVAAVALMALVSCSKEDFNNGVQGGASDIVFSAELEQPAGLPAAEPAEIQSKTSLGTAVGGVRPVSWVAGDQIKINGVTFKAASAGSRTDFTPTSSFNTAATYYAVYPATATSKADHSAITIPASQDGSFAKAAISVAKSSTQSLSFKNVASIIKFQVPAACSTVTISSSANLAGTFPVTFENNLPKIGAVSSPSKTITLSGSFKTNTDYYVAVLPGSHKFIVQMDGHVSKDSDKGVQLNRSNITNLATLPALRPVYLLPNVWDKDGARYAICVKGTGLNDKWYDMTDSNSDGVFEAYVPAGYTSVDFCRMNGAIEANNWDNKWNDTSFLDVPTGNTNYCVKYDWDNSAEWFSVVYLVPGQWNVANARYAICVKKSGGWDRWYNMTDNNGDGVFEGYIPAGYTQVDFCRMDGSKESNEWGSKWNDTGFLTVPSDNKIYCKITGWDNSSSWSATK